jgi:hypothetical protein
MSKETTNDYNNFKRNVENTKDSAKDLASDAVKAGADVLSGNNVKEVAAKIVDEITDFLENRKNDLIGVKGKYKDQIKENPFLIVLGALVAGALLGLLFRK